MDIKPGNDVRTLIEAGDPVMVAILEKHPALLADIQAELDRRRAEGWTRQDFAGALAKMLTTD